MENTLKLLLVEDDQVDQLAFKRFMERENLPYEYQVAGSVAQARAVLAERHFDAVLVDYLLGDGTAFDVFEAARAAAIVVITGSGDEAIAVRAMQAGAYDYLVKDAQASYLAALPITIKKAIERRRDEEELRRYREHLEELVAERTAELTQANQQLRAEIAERLRVNRELLLLNRVIAASAVELEPERILETACRELARALELPYAVAGMLDEQKTRITIVAEYRPPEQPSLLNQIITVEGNPTVQYLITHNVPLVVEDAQHDPRLEPLRDLLHRRGTVSAFFLPFVVKGETVGGLSLGAPQVRHFSAEEVSLAHRVAEQVSGVLARAQLNEERRRLEEQYHQAQKMEAIGLLAGGIAHDFNNLLTAITGFAELTQFQLLPSDPVQELVEKILGSGRRAADLVRQLLAFSRKQIIQPQVLDLNAAVADMERMLRRIIGEDIRLETSLGPELWRIEVDPAQIGQVIVNLAVNARDAMPTGGNLTIETGNQVLDQTFAMEHPEAQPGEYVHLVVSDTGVGMNDAVKAHLFEPFFTTKEKGKGTGLGLATVYGIVKQSGGHITVESEEGQGATFHIYLPRSKATLLPLPGPQAGQELPSGGETILLVEDDVNVRELTRSVLRWQNYTVLEARDGHEAQQLAASHAGPIHLLLTDVVMPGIGGVALAKQLTQARPTMKTLFMSGYTDEAIAHHGVVDTDVAVLQKPFNATTLARRVRQILDAPSA